MWARVIDQAGIRTVAEIVDWNPEGLPADIRGQFVPVEPGMVYRAEWRNGAWVAPPAPEPDPNPQPEGPTYRTKISRAEYYGLFTAVEEAMIRLTAAEPVTIAAIQAATGAEKQKLIGISALRVMLARTDALGSDKVFDLANPQVGEGLDLLVSLGLLTAERKAEILKGVIA